MKPSRWRKDLSLYEKVLDRSHPVKNGCRIWDGATSGNGYGSIWNPLLKRCVYAHRVAWESVNGSIPAGYSVLHRCDNPACVNPEHLFVGTQKDNIQDGIAKGRIVVGEHHPSTKLSEMEVRQILAIGRTESLDRIGEHFGINRRTVGEILNGQRWKQLHSKIAKENSQRAAT